MSKKASEHLTIGVYGNLLREFAAGGVEQRATLISLFPERYKIFLPAMTAYEEIFKVSGAKNIRIVSGGIRDGYFYKNFFVSGK